jgi:hypothetical protein
MLKDLQIKGSNEKPRDFAYSIVRSLISEANSAFDVFKGCIYISMLRQGQEKIDDFQDYLSAFVKNLMDLNKQGTKSAKSIVKLLKEKVNL